MFIKPNKDALIRMGNKPGPSNGGGQCTCNKCNCKCGEVKIAYSDPYKTKVNHSI